MIWREPTEWFDAGDRRLRLMLPPIFDGPTTQGLVDERTGVMWAVDSFAALAPDAHVHRVEEVPQGMYDETFHLINSLVSPWHQWLDPVRYDAHVDTVEAAARRRRDRARPRADRRRHPRRLRPGARSPGSRSCPGRASRCSTRCSPPRWSRAEVQDVGEDHADPAGGTGGPERVRRLRPGRIRLRGPAATRRTPGETITDRPGPTVYLGPL